MDAEGDTYGAATGETLLTATLGCDGAGMALNALDCDDTDPAISPAGEEHPADGADGDCDGNEACWVDADGDGHGSDTRIEVIGIVCCDRSVV